jgi:hypothetical protein
MSGLQIGVEVDDGSIDGAVRSVRRELARKLRKATQAAGRETQLAARAQVNAAFSRVAGYQKSGSARLANAWRGKLYPEDSQSETFDPAYLVYTKAPKIIAAFETGATIVPKHGRFLAIPTIETGRNVRRAYARRLTPELWVKENRVALRFVPMPYGGVLIADLQRFKRGRKRKGRPDTFVVRRQKPQVMFVLLRQTTLKKRLDAAGLARRAGGSYRNTVASEVGA